MARGVMAAIAGLVAFSGCAKDAAVSSTAIGDAYWAQRVRNSEAAVRERPDDVELRIAALRALREASYFHLDRAKAFLAEGEDAKAAYELERALEYDPTNRYALAQLEEIRADLSPTGGLPRVPIRQYSPLLDRQPRLDPGSDDEIRLEFPEGSSLKTVLETLAALAGVNILFDESFRDRRIEVHLDGVTFEEALDLLTSMNGLFYKVTRSSVTVREQR